VRLTELGLCRGAAVPGKTGDAGPGERGDDAGLRVDLPNHVVVALGNVHVAVGVELNFVRHVQGGSRRRSAIAAVRLLSIASDGGCPMRP
jgi:hypothetical protein